MKMSLAEFTELRDLIYKRTGMFFAEKKLFFVQRHVLARAKECRFASVQEYLRYLKFSDFQGSEFQQLANLVTTNETYFFREFDQLACFAEDNLPELMNLHAREKLIKVWCAACSTGEEAYTLSIILKEFLPAGWRYQILATDIDQNVLTRARTGVYNDRSVKEVPDEYYSKYITHTRDGHSVNANIRDSIRFEHLNLMDESAMQRNQNFDAVFCRNVLIYFDDLSRRTVVNYLYNALRSGGYIYLGHSESVGRITSKFHLRRFSKVLVYQKPH
jgi:chemotaxis protein methyltransferase CheR